MRYDPVYPLSAFLIPLEFRVHADPFAVGSVLCAQPGGW